MGFLFALVLLAVALPLVGHGCHGGDEDHEPAVGPPVHAAPTAPSPR